MNLIKPNRSAYKQCSDCVHNKGQFIGLRRCAAMGLVRISVLQRLEDCAQQQRKQSKTIFIKSPESPANRCGHMLMNPQTWPDPRYTPPANDPTKKIIISDQPLIITTGGDI